VKLPSFSAFGRFYYQHLSDLITMLIMMNPIHILIFINKLSRLPKLIGSFFFLIIRKTYCNQLSYVYLIVMVSEWEQTFEQNWVAVGVHSNTNLVLLHKLII